MFCTILLWNHPVQGFCVPGPFDYCFNFTSCYRSVRLCPPSWFSFGRLCFCRNLSTYPSCPISWHIFVHSNFLQSFVFLCYQLYFLLYFWFNLVLSLFFLMNMVKGLSVFFIFSNNQFLDLLILWTVLLFSVSFNSALILIISFLLRALDFVCCCSFSSFRCRDRLFELSLSSLGRPVLLWISLLGLPSQLLLFFDPSSWLSSEEATIT